MTPTPHDERLLKALAHAIVVHPRATLKELAETAGVSKATLHRFCGTRDNLVAMLENHGEQVLNQVIANAALHTAAPLEAVRHLIAEHLKHREMLVFLMFQYRPDTLLGDSEDRRWLTYTRAMDAFFLRAQQMGVLRIDISAAVFTEVFITQIYAMVGARSQCQFGAGLGAIVPAGGAGQGLRPLAYAQKKGPWAQVPRAKAVGSSNQRSLFQPRAGQPPPKARNRSTSASCRCVLASMYAASFTKSLRCASR